MSRRCEVHDVPSAAKIARLEAETGIDPDAEKKLRERTDDFMTAFYDPDLTDCGNWKCRRRRGLA